MTVALPRGAAERSDDDDGSFATVANNSASVAFWTAVSRATGFVRVVTIAAVLGPTYFGNVFQGLNLLPNATYELLAGGLLASLLVPAIVHHVDMGDRAAAERVAGGFLGVLLVAFSAVVLLLWVLGPLVSRLFVLGVSEGDALDLQARVGWLLVLFVAPQLVCYGIAGTGAAAQNACGRFALPAGAPVVENVGVITTMVVSALAFGTGQDLGDVSRAQVVVLGVGATASVAAHAALQWWGAHRAGVRLRPRAGWRDPEVRAVGRLAVPSAGLAVLLGLRYLGLLVVAASVPGGVVAFTMAVNLFNLPIALGAKPVAAALLPRLSRLARADDRRRFRDEWVQGLGLAFFVCVPAAVGYAVLCRPLAGAAAFGEMATDDGVLLIAVSLAAVAVGLLGEAAFVVGLSAAYATGDAHAPLRSMLLRMAVTLPGMVLAAVVGEGWTVLLLLGLALAAGDLVSGAALTRRLAARLPRGGANAVRPLLRSLAAAGVMAVPAGLVAWNAEWRGLEGPALGAQVLAAVAVGAVAFVALQLLLRAPEPRYLAAAFTRRGTSP